MMFYINQNTQMRCANFFCWLASKMGPISVARAARRRSQWPCPSAWGAMCSGHALASSTAPHPSPPPLPSYPGGVSAMVATLGDHNAHGFNVGTSRSTEADPGGGGGGGIFCGGRKYFY